MVFLGDVLHQASMLSDVFWRVMYITKHPSARVFVDIYRSSP